MAISPKSFGPILRASPSSFLRKEPALRASPTASYIAQCITKTSPFRAAVCTLLFLKAPYLLCSRNLQIEGNSPLSFSKNQPPSAATPYPASPDFPLFRGQNNPLYDSPILIGLRQQKSSPEGLLFSLEKLLIRPILLHGRAQAFCFNESARGSRRGGMSVSSRKYRYSHSCHQDF